MISVTRYVLKHPVTTIMCLLCLLVFGISSVLNATLEQMPAMETPTLMINARYSGAGPEDIDELLTQPIEDALSTMEGVDSIESQSSDGSARIQLTYDYGTNIDEAYEDVKKQIDNLERRLPEDATVSVMQMAMNSSTTMMLTITHDRQDRLYDYVDQQIVPEQPWPCQEIFRRQAKISWHGHGLFGMRMNPCSGYPGMDLFNQRERLKARPEPREFPHRSCRH